jgi:hypothetical protein
MAIDEVRQTETGMIVAGRVASAGDLGRFVSSLNQNPRFTAVFSEIKQSRYASARSDTVIFNFEVAFRLKSAP